MSFSSIEPAKTIVKTSNLSDAELLAANEVISTLQPLSPFNSKHVKPANAIPIFIPITIEKILNYEKPNAIVRPLIRKNEIRDDMTAPRSNETIIPLSSQFAVLKQDNPARIKNKEILNDAFARKFEVKLKHLPKDKKSSSNNVNINFYLK